MKKRPTPKIVLSMALALIGIAAATPARAQGKMSATVPFEFIVGTSRLPAGKYFITKSSTNGVLSIQSADTRHHLLVLTNADSGTAPAHPELVFKRVEGQSFLSRVTVGYSIEREIPLTPATMRRARDVAMEVVKVPWSVE